MEQIVDLDNKIKEMADRIRDLRLTLDLSVSDMARGTGLSEDEYTACESGLRDLNFTFIYKCANIFKVNVTDIIEGNSPKLKSYTVTRAGAGQRISQAHGMTYYNLAYAFQNRIAEPLYVRSIYNPEAQNREIEVTTHEGQECDLV
ncbi:MAG: acyl-CoA synthetase, partial [Clostridia bacterium]|nr:acyl-CoA synthetase [Clostridia bacterium]